VRPHLLLKHVELRHHVEFWRRHLLEDLLLFCVVEDRREAFRRFQPAASDATPSMTARCFERFPNAPQRFAGKSANEYRFVVAVLTVDCRPSVSRRESSWIL
jgi:hypothetical protein